MPLLTLLRRPGTPAPTPTPTVPATPVLLPALRVRMWLYIGFEGNPYSPAQWSPRDLSDRTSAVTITRGRSSDVAGADPGSMVLTLDNSDGALDPDNAMGPFHGPLFRVGTKYPVMFTVEHEFEGSFRPLGTAVLDSIDRTWTPGGRVSQTVVTAVDLTSTMNRLVPAQGWVFNPKLPGHRIAELFGVPSRTNERFLQTAPTSSPFPALQNGSRMLGAVVTDGKASLWDYAREAAFAENGLVFFAADGRLTFHSEYHRRRGPVRAVLGDEDGETDVEADLTFRYASDAITHEVAYSTVDGPGDDDQWTAVASRPNVVGDPVPEDGKGSYEAVTGTYTAPGASGTVTALADVHQVAARARYDFRRANTVRRGAETVTLNVLAAMRDRSQTSPYRVALDLELSDRVTLNRRPSHLETAQTGDYFVEQITHTIEAGQQWRTTLRLGTASGMEYAWLLGFDRFNGDPALMRLTW